jgi:hypothetical protein
MNVLSFLLQNRDALYYEQLVNIGIETDKHNFFQKIGDAKKVHCQGCYNACFMRVERTPYNQLAIYCDR